MISLLMQDFSILKGSSNETNMTMICYEIVRKFISLKKYLSAYLKHETPQQHKKAHLSYKNYEIDRYHDDTGPYDDDGEPE